MILLGIYTDNKTKQSYRQWLNIFWMHFKGHIQGLCQALKHKKSERARNKV